MTTIIAVQGDGFAVISVDSRISRSYFGGASIQTATLKDGSSKVAPNGKYLLGAAGDVRAINIIQHVFQPPTPPPNLKGKKLDQFFTAKFIPALRECFDAQGYSVPDIEDKEHIAEQGSAILVVINGTIYIVDSDYSWSSDSYGLYSVGSGSDYALGAMQILTHNKKQTIQQAKTNAIKALIVTARYDPYTGPPFHTFVQEQDGNRKTAKPV